MSEEKEKDAEMSMGKVSKNKINKLVKQMIKQHKLENRHITEKEQDQIDRIGRGYEKIFKLIDRGINNVANS